MIDFGKGWRDLANPITVSLLKRASGEYLDPQTVEHVQKNRETKEEATRGPATTDHTITAFHLWADWLAGTAVDKGDKIVEEDGTSWHVTGVQLMGHKTRYRAEARKDRPA